MPFVSHLPSSSLKSKESDKGTHLNRIREQHLDQIQELEVSIHLFVVFCFCRTRKNAYRNRCVSYCVSSHNESVNVAMKQEMNTNLIIWFSLDCYLFWFLPRDASLLNLRAAVITSLDPRPLISLFFKLFSTRVSDLEFIAFSGLSWRTKRDEKRIHPKRGWL